MRESSRIIKQSQIKPVKKQKMRTEQKQRVELPLGVKQHHMITGAKENHQLNYGRHLIISCIMYKY